MKNLLTSALLALVCAAAAARAGVPTMLNYQGRMLDASGEPIEGPVAIAVAVFDAETDGTMVYTQEVGAVDAQNGLFSFAWGDTGLADALTNAQCWLQVHVNGAPLTPRQRLVAVPYAVDALRAAGLAGALPSLQLAPAAAEAITNAPAPAGTLRLADDGSLYVNTNGTLEGWTTIAGGGRATSYGELLVSPLALTITNVVGESYVTSVTSTNSGLSAFDYAIAVVYQDGAAWLSATPTLKVMAEGASFAHTVTADASALTAGIYRATLRFDGNQWNGPQSVAVTHDVRALVTNEVDHDTSMEFAAGVFMDVEDVGAGAAPQVRNVYNLAKLPYGLGSGVDGDLNISANTTFPAGRSVASASVGATNINVTNKEDFPDGSIILIHQTAGSGAGNWELNKVHSSSGFGAGDIYLTDPLHFTYTDSGASQVQAVRLRQYNNITIQPGAYWYAPAWDGNVGGILAFMAKGTVTVSGTISASGLGYRGNGSHCYTGFQGEGQVGTGGSAANANGTGGGGGKGNNHATDVKPNGGGGGGGHATAGGDGNKPSDQSEWGRGGGTAGNAELTSMVFGGGGGGAATVNANGWWCTGHTMPGRSGGGIVLALARELNVPGLILSQGLDSEAKIDGRMGYGGAGAGGSVLLRSITASLGSGRVIASGGGVGAAGGSGRIRVDYGVGGVSGSTTPAASSAPMGYDVSGTYRSDGLATPLARAYGNLHWTVTGGSSARARTRSAATEGALGAAAWSDWLTASGEAIATPADEWFQYEIELNGTESDPPVLSRVRFDYEAMDN